MVSGRRVSSLEFGSSDMPSRSHVEHSLPSRMSMESPKSYTAASSTPKKLAEFSPLHVSRESITAAKTPPGRHQRWLSESKTNTDASAITNTNNNLKRMHNNKSLQKSHHRDYRYSSSNNVECLECGKKYTGGAQCDCSAFHERVNALPEVSRATANEYLLERHRAMKRRLLEEESPIVSFAHKVLARERAREADDEVDRKYHEIMHENMHENDKEHRDLIETRVGSTQSWSP